MNKDALMMGPECNTPQRQGQVSQQAEHLASALLKAEAAVGRLEERVRSVVRDEPETQCESPDNPALVLLADGIRVFGERANQIANRVDAIVERLEL